MAAKKQHKKKALNSRKVTVLIVIFVLLLAVGALAYQRHSDSNSAQDTPSDQSNSKINYGPPTEQDKSDTQAHKDDLSQSDQTQTPTDSSGKKQVTPVITEADENQVTAYVPGIFEDGGTCTATFSHGSTTLTKTSQGFANATYTNCTPFNLGNSFFNATGQWSVTVAYKSASSEGTSAKTLIEVK